MKEDQNLFLSVLNSVPFPNECASLCNAIVIADFIRQQIPYMVPKLQVREYYLVVFSVLQTIGAPLCTR